MPAIEALEVTKSFGELHALGPVSFRIAHGAQVCLLGESGSGKSTLLNLVAGTLTPSSGSLIVEGLDVGRASDAALSRYRLEKLGYVHQFFDLVSDLTALENVELPLWLAGVTESRFRAINALERMDLAHRGDSLVSVLSGGDQQRVAVARAVILEPSLILADEPTGNLDSKNGGEVLNLLFSEAARLKSTLLLATHSQEAAARFAERMVLKDGRLIEATRGVLL